MSIDENEASPRPPAAEQRWRRELRRQQIAMLVRQAPLLALVNLVNGALVAFVLWEQAARLPLALWFAGVVVLALYPLRAWWSSRRHPAPGSGSQRSIRRAAVLGGLAGLLWASTVPLFLWHLDDEIILFLAVVLSGMAAAGAVVLASIPRAAIAYSLPIFAAVIAVTLNTGEAMLAMLGAMLILFFLTVTLASRSVFLGTSNALRDQFLEAEEKALHQGRFEDFATAASDWFWELDAACRYSFVSDLTTGKFDQEVDWYLGRPLDETIERFYDRRDWEPFYRAFEARLPYRDLVARRVGDDGTVQWIRCSGVPIVDSEGVFLGYRNIATDITQTMQAEAALRESEQRFRDLIESAVQGIFIFTADWRPLFVNQALADMFGYSTPEPILELASLEPLVAPSEVARLGRIRAARFAGATDPSLFEFEGRRRDGSTIWLLNHTRMIEWHGQPALQATVVDITDRKLAEQALQQSEARLGGVLGLAPDAIVAVDEDQIIRLFNRGAETIFGYTAEEAVGEPAEILIPERFHGLHRRHVEGFATSTELARRMDLRSDIVGRRRDGSEFPAEASISKLELDDRKLLTVILRDITDRKQREEMLRQAQRMEAVGQLTGGIAHDFNNLLAIIQGNLSLLNRKLDESSALKALIEPALRAARRGASLTQRLQAFSRRQPLDPARIDAGRLVSDLADVLRHGLGGNVAIEISVAPDLWACEVDAGQLEQTIVNLANNAREAMPGGGKLTISVANAQLSEIQAAQQVEASAGDYVMIQVTDTGTGMTAEVRARIFEPFFTTKDIGRGTGLGLAMVFGFAQQSGGHVSAYSEPGLGSTIKIYLPRVAAGAAAEDGDGVPVSTVPPNETVLVVEDDTDVRTLAVVALSDLGYRVQKAGSGAQALRLLDQDDRIDLLLVDLVLAGGISGTELAAAVTSRIPWLKVLYMSGYPENALLRDGRLGPGALLLQKPFDTAELARAVRAAIDS